MIFCPKCNRAITFPAFGCSRCDGLPPLPGFATEDDPKLLELARRVVANQYARRNENVEEWAKRLAQDVADAND